MLTLDAPHGVHIFSDHSETKIRNTRITRVYEDVLLDTCQYTGELELEQPHTPRRSP